MFEPISGYQCTNTFTFTVFYKPKRLANQHSILLQRFPSKHKDCRFLMIEQDYKAGLLLVDRRDEYQYIVESLTKRGAWCQKHPQTRKILTSNHYPFLRETLCKWVAVLSQEQMLRNQEVDQQQKLKRKYVNTHAKDNPAHNREPRMALRPISHLPIQTSVYAHIF